jgi:hypothetical protein
MDWCKGAVDELCTKAGMSLALKNGEVKPDSKTRQRRNKGRFLGSSFIQKMASRKRGLEEGVMEL